MDETIDMQNGLPIEYDDLPDKGESGIYHLDSDGKWKSGSGVPEVYIPSDSENENTKPRNDILKDSIVEFNVVLNAANLARYIEYELWAFLQDDNCTDSPIELINGCKSPAEFKVQIEKNIKEIKEIAIMEMSKLESKYDKLSFLKSELLWAKKSLISLGYPISLDFFGNYKMVIPEEIPNRYRLWWNKNELYSEDAKDNFEKIYIPKVINIRFDAISDYILFLNNQIDIVQSLKILEISQEHPKIEMATVGIEIPDTKQLEGTQFYNPPNSKTQGTITKLDIRQTALLFYYLKEHGLIIDHSLATLSLHVSKLTGFSQQNLRANDGFSIVNDIMNDSPAGKLPRFDKIKNFNLTVLRRALVEIIADIDSQMKKNLEDPT